MLDDATLMPAPYRVVIVTLDAHAAGPAGRIAPGLAADFPGLTVEVHAAAEWSDPAKLHAAREAVGRADIAVVSLLFLEEHIEAILPALQARRPHADAVAGLISDRQIVTLTRMGDLDMTRPAPAAIRMLKALRGGGKSASGRSQMRTLKRLPKILRFVPGKAQDLRAWLLTMQYWLGGSDDNMDALVRSLIARYGPEAWRGGAVAAPVERPEVGLWHPDTGVVTDATALPRPEGAVATVGMLLMRSYVMSGDTAHYAAVVRAMEARGLAVVPAYAGGLDARPAIAGYLDGGRGGTPRRIDALVSLTGFSLVGGPAYNDAAAAVDVLRGLDVPYVAAHPLEFQTLAQWAAGPGLGPVETTMMVALPEIDGATNPHVFAGRHAATGCEGCARRCGPGEARVMAPCFERIDALADRTLRLARLRRSEAEGRRVAIVLFGFPPNAGAAGTAAYLSVFESLHATLRRMAAEGYRVDVPETVDDLRAAVLGGGGERGQEASVLAHVTADEIVAKTPWLAEVEGTWGPAPGRHQSDGRGVFVLGASFGDVVVGVQPAFGVEGDPMRLMFEGSHAPTHAFVQFYRWLREDFAADAVLHFGMHGALEFMPGHQAGPGASCWPDRLIGDLPNVYLYAANNPSEASLAKRRSGAVTISHLTPPLQQAGLYRGLADLKDSLSRHRALPGGPEREAVGETLAAQAEALDMDGAPDDLWRLVLEAEGALIPEGLHVLGRTMTPEARARLIAQMREATPGLDAGAAEAALAGDHEIPALLRALSGRFTPPVPGGDVIRAPEILPTGRNLHAFDPFRMPTAFAMADGARQAEALLATHETLPRSVALVLWGSDNIKSGGGPIAQAMALMGAVPRHDSFGRLSGADLIPLEALGRPRIDVVMTLSGIFRDLLPLQTKMLAEAALKAASADEPAALNHVRAHALGVVEATGCTIEEAALRVFSNAEGAYGSNVNQIVDAGAWDDEGELADALEARKSFAYGTDGRAAARPDLFRAALRDVEVAYQNLESVELGVTSVDHYFDTLGGIARAVKRARGSDAAVYVGDQTRGGHAVRTLRAQVALETRTRALNPRFYEPLLEHGHEGVRAIESHVTNTLGWSATTGSVDPWVYQRLSETFVLDEAMRRRLSDLNPTASSRMANRLIEASDRAYWAPDADTLAALQDAADELEDRMEGVAP